MAKTVQQILEMPKDKYEALCHSSRKHVEENFTVEKMVDGYEGVYEKVIEEYMRKNPKS